MIDNFEEAADHPDMTEDLAEVLSTRDSEIEYRGETAVSIRD
jgi:hypothetical protein